MVLVVVVCEDMVPAVTLAAAGRPAAVGVEGTLVAPVLPAASRLCVAV